jgi:hypothetical protein
MLLRTYTSALLASLCWALPTVKKYIGQIRQRFPNMHFAVVTHGRELFALQKNRQDNTAAAGQGWC